MKLLLRTSIWLGVFLLFCTSASVAEMEIGFFNPYVTKGPRIAPETLTPVLRKWYLPQTLYELYGWKGWEYTNYASDIYERYVNLEREGDLFYDMYGSYIMKGYNVYTWSQEYPRDFGSSVFKHPHFRGWFNRVLVSSSSKGQFHMALTIGEAIRTTLTPLTFSKPLFDGLQWDFMSDKYALTFLASRADNPAPVAIAADQGGSNETIFTQLLGFRGTYGLGDFAKIGFTYVNSGHQNSAIPMDDNSLKGVLGGRINAGNVMKLIVRLSDDSPEDGKGGALLLRERIFIDGVEHSEIEPLIEGGITRKGVIEASGGNTITLTYDIEHDFRAGVADEITDFKEIRKIEVGLVLANDYRVEIASNMQTNASGEPAFLLVTRAPGNITDASNQKFMRFQYGLPTGNELGGFTFEVTDVSGFNLKAEYVSNRRFRRFPNQNIRRKQALATDRSEAFYVTASQIIYPWFAYGEVFRMEPEYSTSMFIPDGSSFIDYENEVNYLYEFVEDNDDQDRFPDWRRRYTGEYTGDVPDREVFPGLDENNDLVSDFNQNDNIQPDYVEPFLRYDVDPPEFLFGMDMNNNTVIDRFENDMEPDYPYRRDHYGYNFYTGVEIMPDSRLIVGRLREKLISSGRKNRTTYALLTLHKELPAHGLSLRLMEFARRVRDNIPEDLIQWVQPEFSSGLLQPFSDPLIAQDTFINTIYLEAVYTELFPFTAKIKYETHHQGGDQAEDKENGKFLGIISKADYKIPMGKDLSIWPKWKQMLAFRTPTDPRRLETKDLSEIFFLVVRYQFSHPLWITSGVEFELFNNLEEEPDPLPPGFVQDFDRWTLAFQLSNQCDYMGYRLTSNAGVRWTRRDFEGDSTTNTMAFVSVYAGWEE